MNVIKPFTTKTQRFGVGPLPKDANVYPHSLDALKEAGFIVKIPPKATGKKRQP